MDMEWYGMDRQGHLAVFCSAGTGHLPAFVCEDVERADALIEFFDQMEARTTSVLLTGKTGQAAQAARTFSDRGLYYFDADDGSRNGVCTLHPYYTKQSCPKEPLQVESLPAQIQESLQHNLMEIDDFALCTKIRVKHAYD